MQNTDIIRPESSHTIHGVEGRMHNLRRPPTPWKAGTFANQKWVASRPVKGWGQGATLTVTLRFDDQCKNGLNSFAVTGEIRRPGRGDCEACGCLHEEIAKVFPELGHLIKWHGTSTDSPMHYLANAIYHAKQHGPNRAWVYFTGQIDPLGIAGEKERLLGYVSASEAAKAESTPGYRVEWDAKTAKTRNVKFARSSAVWPDAPDSVWELPEPELKSILEARLPALMAEFKADMESCGFLWSCPAA